MFDVSFSFRRPANLGVNNGRFAPCKRSPNCVCSQADPADREHYIAPIAFKGGIAELQEIVEAQPRASVIRAEGNYLYAEFRTRLLRFVDDLEFLLSENQVHVRSASRLGRRDFGVNRGRVEALRKLILARR